MKGVSLSNIPSAGSRDSGRQRRGWLPLILAVAAVGLALYVGTQVIGVLYSILSPPLPPLPDNVIEMEHTSEAHGVDTWQYATAQDACSLTRFYESNGGTCIYAPDRCEDAFIDLRSVRQGDNVSQCSGEMNFSIFALRWEAVIATGYEEETPTHYKLSREVFWTGAVPPPMFSEEAP
jgi:hypothetical protein